MASHVIQRSKITILLDERGGEHHIFDTIFFFQFITMQEFELVSQFIDEFPPGTAHSQIVVGQRAQATP